MVLTLNTLPYFDKRDENNNERDYPPFALLEAIYMSWFSFEFLVRIYLYLLTYFSAPQILCEINFEESRSSKPTFFAILVALNFGNLVDFSIQKLEKLHQYENSEPLSLLCVKMADFESLNSLILISHKTL